MWRKACAGGCLVGTIATVAFATPAAFHAALSAPEQALARVLKLDEGLGDRWINPTDSGRNGHRPRITPPKDARYLRYLTAALAADLLRQEARQVNSECGGVYKTGELCGLDYDPISCAQDDPEYYLFRTERSDPKVAIVDAAWPAIGPRKLAVSGRYRLVFTDGVWKVDAVACPLGDRFNWLGR